MNSKIKIYYRKPHLNNKAVVNAQQSVVIKVDLLFVMARTATLNLENPDWRTGTWGILGVFRHHGHVGAFFLVPE
jgi:hypothetical protein